MTLLDNKIPCLSKRLLPWLEIMAVRGSRRNVNASMTLNPYEGINLLQKSRKSKGFQRYDSDK